MSGNPIQSTKVLHIAETIRGGIASYLNELHPQQQASFGAENLHYVVPSDHRRDLVGIENNQITTFARSGRSVFGLFQMLRASMQALDAFRPDVVISTPRSQASFSARRWQHVPMGRASSTARTAGRSRARPDVSVI